MRKLFPPVLFFLFLLASCGGMEGPPSELISHQDPQNLNNNPPKPNLAPYYNRPGWSDAIVPSHTQGATIHEALWECKPTYINVVFRNTEEPPTNGNTIWTNIYDNGQFLDAGWTTAILQQNDEVSTKDMRGFTGSPYTFSAGVHNIGMFVDSVNNIDEFSEVDNKYDRDFYWQICNPPSVTIDAPANGSSTAFAQVTFSGACTDPDGNLKSVILKNETPQSGWSKDIPIAGHSCPVREI